MKYIDKSYNNEIVIQKSRFITSIYNVSSIEEVNAILSDTRKKYYDATHNCYAYILGDDMQIQKCSDDGEPSKTAGFPILDVLKKNNTTNILCIVTRYFGGILLGTGGLVRAYSDSCAECLRKASFLEKKELNTLIVKIDYSSYNQLLNIKYITILDSSFQDVITLKLAYPKEMKKDVFEFLNSISRGKAFITESYPYMVLTPIN